MAAAKQGKKGREKRPVTFLHILLGGREEILSFGAQKGNLNPITIDVPGKKKRGGEGRYNLSEKRKKRAETKPHHGPSVRGGGRLFAQKLACARKKGGRGEKFYWHFD